MRWAPLAEQQSVNLFYGQLLPAAVVSACNVRHILAQAQLKSTLYLDVYTMCTGRWAGRPSCKELCTTLFQLTCGSTTQYTFKMHTQAVQAELQAALDPADLAQYAIRGGDADFEEALGGAAPAPGLLNVKAVDDKKVCCSAWLSPALAE